MNILIFSGGTGSIALQNGLKSYSNKIKITNLINLYDDGKSTGVCKKIMGVLGPSDLRKNQYTQWKNKKIVDKRIDELFTKRFDYLVEEDAVNFIKNCNFEKDYNDLFIQCIHNFFNRFISTNIYHELKDFNLANIIYSVLFVKIGYDETIEFMKKFLDIEDDVVLNSYEFANLKAQTKNGQIIHTEGEIVNHNNLSDPISNVFLTNGSGSFIFPTLCDTAIKAIFDADIIIFSAGTQFSSLIPTYKTVGFTEAIDKSKATKYFVMNNTEDGDMYGWNSIQILSEFFKYIKNPKSINIILNYNADERLSIKHPSHNNYITGYFGNYEGKHDPKLLAKEILKHYYNIDIIRSKNIMTDFDDTLFSRKKEDEEISVKNIELFESLSKIQKCAIVSGNSYERIKNKLSMQFGLKLEDISFDIYCDGGLVEYINGKIEKYYNEYMMNFNEIKRMIHQLKYITNKDFEVEYRGVIDDKNLVSCVSLIRLEKEYRDLLYIYLNYYFLHDYKVEKTGIGTIDIFKIGYDKNKIFELIKDSPHNWIYIGDEIKNGNDENIAKCVHHATNVNDVYEMNVILRLLNEF